MWQPTISDSVCAGLEGPSHGSWKYQLPPAEDREDSSQCDPVLSGRTAAGNGEVNALSETSEKYEKSPVDQN